MVRGALAPLQLFMRVSSMIAPRRHVRCPAATVLVMAVAWLLPPALIAREQPAALVHPQRWPQAASPGLLDRATEAKISELMSRMRLEEKVGQVIQTDISAITPPDLYQYPLGAILAGADSRVNGKERTPGAWLALAREFHAAALKARPEHLPIPILFGIDAVHGDNDVAGAVIYPHNIGLGATHDAALVRRIGAATAQEVAATGMDWTFAPTLAVPQDVRWGRSYEGFSENPSLVRLYAAAAVEGLQGGADLSDKLQAGHIAATAKHFLGDGGTDEGVDEGNTLVDEAELIRTHVQGYLGAIDAGVLTVMVSYSSWQGTKMHANRALLTEVLKQRLGFEGFVVGDWDAHAQVPGCASDRCPAAFNAGVDMFMAPLKWRTLYDNTLAEVRSGEIPLARLEDAVRRILRVKYKLGLFNPARPYEGRLELVGAAEHRALAREAVRKSLVLLKNDGALPIRSSARVWVTGPGADSIGMQCGGWTLSWQGTTSNADFPNAQSIQAGFKEALAAGGGRLVDGTDLIGPDRPDVVVMVYGETPYAEMLGDVQFALYNTRAALRALAQLRSHGIPVVSVFLSGRPLWVRSEIEASNAFVAAWLPGTEGGGVADVLIGDAAGRARSDFSGRLAFAWPNGRQFGAGPGFKAAGDDLPLGYGLRYKP
jgi:beta-glucosidase